MGRRLYIHVGLPKTGTTFLQAVLAQNRPRLREHGFVYPFVRKEGMFHAAVELCGQHERWGLQPELIDGTWAALCRRASESGDTAIVSHEILGGADRSQISAALQVAEGFDVHVVVTARDLARQVPAHWQEQVKNGQTYTFAEYQREIVDPGRTGRVDEFWQEQDLLGVLGRWGESPPPQNVHVVIAPPQGAPPAELWSRFAQAVGLDGVPLELDTPRTNESLGAVEIALLRRVNLLLADELTWTDYAHTVKRFFAQRILPQAAGDSGRRPLTPAVRRPQLEEVTRSWAEEIRTRGYRVHGSLDDLTPLAFATAGPTADEVTEAELSELAQRVVAGLLQSVAAARSEHATDSGGPHDAAGPTQKKATVRAMLRRALPRGSGSEPG